MQRSALLSMIVASAVLTLGMSGEVSAKRTHDNLNYGYCPVTLKRVPDVRRCRAFAANGFQPGRCHAFAIQHDCRYRGRFDFDSQSCRCL